MYPNLPSWFILSFTSLINTYLLSTYLGIDIILGTSDTILNGTDKVPYLMELTAQWKKESNKHINE